jgi:hypothetical protein
MKRVVSLFAILLISVAAAGAPSEKLAGKYEAVRQALIKGSLADAQSGARQLAAAARDEKQPTIADRANAVAGASTIKAARQSFAALSDELIKARGSEPNNGSVIMYCSMYKASWVQPKGAITNPYSEDESMRACGEVKGR